MLKRFPIGKAFQFIEPGPVVLVTTAHKGRLNIMTMTWHMVVDFTPKIACIIGPWDFTYEALMATKECVIAVPTVDMISKVIDIGNVSGRDTDKFKMTGLTPLPAKKVKAPLIAQCLHQIECRLIDTSLSGEHGLNILQGVEAWSDPKRKIKRTFHANGDGTFAADGKKMDYRKKMIKLP